MNMVGEWIRWPEAWSWGSVPYTATWSVEMPPSAALAQVGFNFYMEYGGAALVNPGIVSIRRRRPDNSDETVATANAPAVFDPKMTNVTYGVTVHKCQVRVMLDIGFWA
jgi:hypothetical protein